MYEAKTKLKGFFYMNGIKLETVAELLGISTGSVRSKLNGLTDFQCHEVDILIEAFPELNDSYFLASSVARMRTEKATV